MSPLYLHSEQVHFPGAAMLQRYSSRKQTNFWRAFRVSCFYKHQHESGRQHQNEGKEEERITRNMKEEESVFSAAG